MMYRLLATIRRGSLGAWLLVLVALVLSGCETGMELSSAPEGAPSGGQVQSSAKLTVNLEQSVRRSSDVAKVKVYALSLRGAELAQQTVNPRQVAVFSDLPAGSVQIRVVALDARDDVLGYSDVSAVVPTDTKVDAVGLSRTRMMPPPATPGAPFLAYTGLPAVYTAKTKYTIEVGAFDEQGVLDPQATGVVSLSSSGLRATVPNASAPLNHGRAVFTGVNFAQGSNGTVTFAASSAGLAAATSPTLPVRSN